MFQQHSAPPLIIQNKSLLVFVLHKHTCYFILLKIYNHIHIHIHKHIHVFSVLRPDIIVKYEQYSNNRLQSKNEANVKILPYDVRCSEILRSEFSEIKYKESTSRRPSHF